jgi:hypothetical protein
MSRWVCADISAQGLFIGIRAVHLRNLRTGSASGGNRNYLVMATLDHTGVKTIRVSGHKSVAKQHLRQTFSPAEAQLAPHLHV